MAKISIDPAKTKPCVTRMEDVARNLKELSATLDDIRGNMGYKIAGKERIAARLRDVSGQIVREETAVRSMRDGLERIVSQYQRTESLNLGQVVAEAIAQASATTNASGGDAVQSGKDLLKASEEEMNRFISEFEKTHPDEAKKFDKFLKSGENNQIDDDDIRYIKYLAYNAKEPFRSIYLKSLAKHSINNADLNGGAFYRPMYQPSSIKDFINEIKNGEYHKVNYTYDDDTSEYSPDCFENDPRGPYTTFFHETGHAIDDLSDESQWWGSDTEKFTAHSDAMGRDVTLREAIEYDVYYNPNNSHSMTSIANQIVNSGKSGSNGNVGNVIAAFQSGNTGNLSKEDLSLYNAIRNQHLRTTGSSAQYEAVSDVYGGMSHNALRTNYGHDESYWNDTTMAGKELWAEYFSYNMAGDTENLEYLLQYFPEASKVLEEYANAVSK